MNFQDLKETAKIRDRGQLTIPQNIREILTWLKANSLIEIVPQKADRIELRPLVFSQKRDLRKAKTQKEIQALWKKMRTIGRMGRQLNLSEFVIKDRQRH